MRARGQLTEIRAHDLRFTLEEAAQFFNHSMQLNLNTTTVDTIEAHTEGWTAGLQLAAPEGYQTVFFPHPGRPSQRLLQNARALASAFVDDILKKTAPAHGTVLHLIDPLSEQEMRVLKFIVAGQSNQEIAGQLTISPGTAKWHVHNILQKLGVSNRAQAIAKARELGI